MKKHFRKTVLILAAALLVVATHLYITFYIPPSDTPEVRTVTIERGSSFRMVAEKLEGAGVVRSAESFSFAARLLGAYKKVKAGEYEFTTGMTPLEVIDYIVKGKVKKYMVTVPEGFSVREIAAALEAAGLIQKDLFIARALDPQLAAALGLEGPTLEGYLFPDTYAFNKGMSADEMIARMVERFRKVFAEFEFDVETSGMSMRKIITLASIIEKETGAPSERPLISAVFHNRLKKGIKLQSDPTVIYAIPSFDGNIKRRHLAMKSPYNTYAVFGLPPGPIASPGRDAIVAALKPAKVDYLYFVSKNDGTHQFSKSLKEHNRAVNQFQKDLRAAKKIEAAGEKATQKEADASGVSISSPETRSTR